MSDFEVIKGERSGSSTPEERKNWLIKLIYRIARAIKMYLIVRKQGGGSSRTDEKLRKLEETGEAALKELEELSGK